MKLKLFFLSLAVLIFAACKQEPRPQIEVPTLETKKLDTIASIEQKVDTLSSTIKKIKPLEPTKKAIPEKKPMTPPPTQSSKETLKDTTSISKPVKKNKIMVNQNERQ